MAWQPEVADQVSVLLKGGWGTDTRVQMYVTGPGQARYRSPECLETCITK